MKILSSIILSLLFIQLGPVSVSGLLHSPLWSFLIVIGVSVAVHELGHFLAAKISGVGVLKFSIGFGPALWKKTVGGTEYRLGILPLGGYVRMVGDMPDMITGPQATDEEVRAENRGGLPEDEELSPEVKAMIADRSCWFIEKSNLIKAFIVFAGPFANYLLALFLIAVASIVYGIQVPDGTRIEKVSEGSPAEEAGILAEDRIVSINGEEVSSFLDIQSKIQGSNGGNLTLLIKRGEEEKSISVIPKERKSPLGLEKKIYMVGIAGGVRTEYVGVLEGISSSFNFVNVSIIGVVSGLFGLATGEVPLDSVGGPIMIYQVAGKTASKGLDALLYFIAYLNISLGVLNLLPIPVLDGGHLLIFLLESIFGPISIKKKEMAQGIGMAFILGLSIFAIHNDLTRDKDYLKPPTDNWKASESESNK